MAPLFLDYGHGAAREPLLAFGDPEARARILFVPPLFETLNRLRRNLVLTMRDLAGRGHFAMLPDLPGTGDSLTAHNLQALTNWRAAIAACAAEHRATHSVALRSACLVDDAAALPGWRLAPVEGKRILRNLERSGQIGGNAPGGGMTFAGYTLSSAMVAELAAADVKPLAEGREVALGLPEGPERFPGSPLWLRAEPGEDPDMAAAMAANIDEWIASCAAG